ncbi:ABC transporter ATP-binding protein [Candidatus Albibeggiatoa sp. nov. NOAA]|uniref:ABC transporter ATP-binding protein n=1 Tax=Candidatus Albibeggiatoa sp. nov. NOAA TaxID=3162724 RepID=UPI0032F9C60A|nr:ABC transporter ATP-binding protein [Thiotrichaceae bacterium]
MTAIHLHDVHFRWSPQANDILHIPELHIPRGELVFIQGHSGSGKTTLLNLIAGIHRPQQGKVQVLETDLTTLSATKRDQFRAQHLGIIFQQFNLLPYLSLLENVQLSCQFSTKRKAKVGDLLKASLRLLDELQIARSMLHKSVNTLSVGQQQRVAVARALIGQPEIIIADEPTSSLDNDNRQRFLDLLFSEVKQQDSTLIFVSHDAALSTHFSTVIKLNELNLAETISS